MTNLDSILKSRDGTLPTKVHLIKAMVFPVVMYGCESRTIKKAEYQKIDAFELQCWRKLLRLPWTAKKSNQSIPRKSVLSVHWKDWCRSWSSNTLATWCKKQAHWKRTWCWQRLKVGEEDDRGWNGWMPSLTQWTWVWVNSGSWWWTGRPGVLQSMGLQRVRHDWATELNHTPCHSCSRQTGHFLVQSATSGLKIVTCSPFAWHAHAPFLASASSSGMVSGLFVKQLSTLHHLSCYFYFTLLFP